MTKETHDIQMDKSSGKIAIDGNVYRANDLTHEIAEQDNIKTMIITAVNGDSYRFETAKRNFLSGYGSIGNTIGSYVINIGELKTVDSKMRHVGRELQTPAVPMPPTEVLHEPVTYENVSDIDIGDLQFQIQFGNYPIPHYETEPYVYYPINATGPIFQELKQICKSVSMIQVELSNDEAFEFQGQYLAHIMAASYDGAPRLVNKKSFTIHPDGAPVEEFGEYVIRKFEIRFYSQHEAATLIGSDPSETTTKLARDVVKDQAHKYLDAINKKYVCFPSSMLNEGTYVWASAKDGMIKSTTHTTFSVIYPASMEPEPQRLGSYNPNHTPINYTKFIPSLIPEIEIRSNTLGSTEQICPYCHASLPRFPKKKMSCPECKMPIYPRHRVADDQYVLLTEEELEIYEAEKTYQLNGGVAAKANELANRLNVYELASDRWKFDATYCRRTLTPDAEVFRDRIVLIGSPEEKEAIKALLKPENNGCIPAECKMRDITIA